MNGLRAVQSHWHFARKTAAWCCAAVAAGVPLLQAGQRSAPGIRERASGTAAVRGQVLDAQTGSPLRRAQVRASLLESGESWVIETDAEGRYHLGRLPAGRYNLGVTRDGYISLQFGQRQPGDLPAVVLLAEHQIRERTDYRLPRSGAIAGRVVDEFADPRVDVMVVAVESRLVNGRHVAIPAGRSSVTNDLGEFRISGLRPGRYYLSARHGVQADAGLSDSGFGYATTYYPGTSRGDEAQPLTIDLGQEVAGVVLSLVPARTFRITGRVRSGRGARLARSSFTLTNTSALMPSADAIVQQDPDGSFELLKVAPGSYTLSVRARTSNEATAGDEEFGSLEVAVADADVDGIDLVTLTGAAIKGVVRAEPGLNQSFEAARLTVIAVPANSDVGLATIKTSPVSQDGAFELRGVFGARLFSLQGLRGGWELKAVLLNGQDVIDEPTEFKGAEEVSDLVLVVTNKATELSGSVVDADSHPVHEYTVLVFPDDSRKWNRPARYVRAERAEKDGRFRIRSLPPGHYLAVAAAYLSEDRMQDPKFLESLRPEAAVVSLGEAESKSIRLTLRSPSQVPTSQF